jgi:hypothetical protein
MTVRRGGMPTVLRQRLAANLPLQAADSLPASPSSPGPGSGSGVPRASVMRWLAASACPSMQCA